MARKKMAKKGITAGTGEGMYDLEVCSLAPDMPLGLNIRVRSNSAEEARLRAQEILDDMWEGITVLRTGDYDLTDGESVRPYVAEPPVTGTALSCSRDADAALFAPPVTFISNTVRVERHGISYS